MFGFSPPIVPQFIQDQVGRCGQRVVLEPGSHFLTPGAEVDLFALVENGNLRVFSSGMEGREITLYTVEPGECCLINVLCLISGMNSPAFAMAEDVVTAMAFPRTQFLAWIAEREDVRQFVFGIMAGRVTGMMALVEEVAFQRLDCRLAAYLLQKGLGGDRLVMTHEAIASDLGTAREVVSRLLKAFERQGAVSLGRGFITLNERIILENLTD
jgi:CRP/FNR family transcriptional regulator|nr:Crp/Fnr family transcriptional regulator [Candidatus Krumholzibacteria bacterium]